MPLRHEITYGNYYILIIFWPLARAGSQFRIVRERGETPAKKILAARAPENLRQPRDLGRQGARDKKRGGNPLKKDQVKARAPNPVRSGEVSRRVADCFPPKQKSSIP